MILDGKVTAAALEKDIRERIDVLKERGCTLKLAVILAGSSKPSHMYAEFMKKAALSYGIGTELYEKPENVKEDGLFGGTPRAVMAILKHYGISVEGKHAVIIGRSNVIGKPVAMMLMQKNATVTICHSRTKNLSEITQQADILVTAVGKAGCVTADMVKPGAIVLDVGINRIHGKTVGDVDYENVFPVAGAVTPVPGGVGSVTTTMIIESIVKAGEHAAGIK